MANTTTKVSFIYVLMVLVLVALASADSESQSKPKQCNEECPTTRDLVCGYDSNCYARFDNKCLYDRLKCNTKHNLETVDMSLCDLAERKTHPAYRLC
ncbi:uncharacterized protein LOC126762405 [Bactrocera neohumeralis]|uniref:uncharacterized protein LOC120778851 n=1 Tax=Bactrocera tryoni TaxID=59916 RepID=UPI001A9A0E59|nr:uncharacterized protein LOC120778851 [Bactrocera tryoni]XP_050335077.1 uncharacterized protein LOC126762405 [Bactrocera neohumeralis]